MARYEEDLDSLRTQLANLKAKMHDLEAQIPNKNKQLQSLRELIAVKHSQPVKVLTQGPDDSAVTSKFTTLRYAITNLTMVELHGSPFVKPTKTDHKNLFLRLTQSEEDYKQYLGDPTFKSFFFEGVIWTVLIDRLLCCPLSAFQHVEEGVIRDQIYSKFSLGLFWWWQYPDPIILSDHGGASPKKFHAWRAYTADFLEDAFGLRNPWRPRGQLRSQLVSELVELLSRYSTSGKNDAHLTQQLDGVVDKAVNLAWLMAKSRAYWVCSLPTHPETKLPHGFIYMKEIMKVETHLIGGRRGVVDLVGRPSLLKYGDSTGEQYDTYVVFEKANAVVYEGNKSKSADSDYVAG